MRKLNKIILLFALALSLACPAFAHVAGDINAGAEPVAEQPATEKQAEQSLEQPAPEPATVTAAAPATQEQVTEATPVEQVTEADSAETVTEPATEAPTELPINEAAFLPEGNANVVDYAVSESGKEFYVIRTANGNTFYLVLDRDRQADNVYMLAPVDEGDLLDFVTGNTIQQEPSPVQPATEQPTEPTPPTPDTPVIPLTSVLTLAGTLAAAGGGIYYFKVVKPKKAQKKQQAQAEGMEFEDDRAPLNEDQPSKPELFAESEYDDAIG